MNTDFNHFHFYNKKSTMHEHKITPATSPLLRNQPTW